MDLDRGGHSYAPRLLPPSALEKPTECCAICLEDLVDQCEAQPCRHNKFDFQCLITWLQQRATCPLCKTDVQQVRYEVGEKNRECRIYNLPEGFKHRSDPVRAPLPYVDEAIQRRRFVYRHNLYSRHIGSNGQQHRVSSYKELSPERFMADSRLLYRARLWLRRELRVFRFLDTIGDLPNVRVAGDRNQPSKMQFLLQYIIAILQAMDIQDSTGRAEEIIKEYLGRRNTRLLLHELKAWLRSPHDTLRAWDSHIQYKDGTTLPGINQGMGRITARSPDIVLKYSEPAEARKPPSTQAWQLYTFKGDEILETLSLSERSVWLIGRETRVVDVITPHPSCSSQHAVLQFRHITEHRKGKASEGRNEDRIRLYLIDLESTHGTSLNGKRIESGFYIELTDKDVIRFGGSAREYILILHVA